MVYWGIWILCGCLTSLMLYLLDSNRDDKAYIYADNFFMFFIVSLWPAFVVLVAYSILRVMTGGVNDQ